MNDRTLLTITGLPLFTGIAIAFVVAYASAQVVAVRNGVLADTMGNTLYTFDQDAAGRSNCHDECADAWPPFAARAGETASGPFTIVLRGDGVRQWALDGRPLYTFAADTKPGDVRGDGQGGLWHVAKRFTKSGAGTTLSANAK
jgi:predicted lipoprotein with Yx(FWY)xxD motif